MAISIDEIRDYYIANYPIYNYMGLEIDRATPTAAQCSVPLSPGNVNHFGTVHAAIQWAVCETLGGVIFLSNFGVESRFLGVVRDMEIKFLTPATTALVSETSVDDGEMGSVRRSLESTGKADFTLSISLTDSNGAKVAVAEANYHIRDRSLFRGLQTEA